MQSLLMKLAHFKHYGKDVHVMRQFILLMTLLY